MASRNSKDTGSSANLSFDTSLWAAADNDFWAPQDVFLAANPCDRQAVTTGKSATVSHAAVS